MQGCMFRAYRGVTSSRCWVMVTFENLVIKIKCIHLRNSFWISTLYLAVFSTYLKMTKTQPLLCPANSESTLWTIKRREEVSRLVLISILQWLPHPWELLWRPVGLGWVLVCAVVVRAARTRFRCMHMCGLSMCICELELSGSRHGPL